MMSKSLVQNASQITLHPQRFPVFDYIGSKLFHPSDWVFFTRLGIFGDAPLAMAMPAAAAARRLGRRPSPLSLRRGRHAAPRTAAGLRCRRSRPHSRYVRQPESSLVVRHRRQR
jgi:hypothetical protein